ncbi:DUF2797 domain-containing protein [Arthrobacter alpinus]|uniref:DUF2797 domain-containing protein n=1 Tax=Arthrobacter alpinus TaxID=656366 RepID=UPI001EF4C60C|nr:DUF2797 domain-containing protein [Arthrobacter alpinus]
MVEPVKTGLVRGVSWRPGGPALSLIADDADAQLPLSAGQWLRFEVLSGDGIPARYCLGYTSVQGPEDSLHHSCPTHQGAERGFQCGACFARDDLRHMHDFHRSGQAPPGMRSYLSQQHWLYIATFADGTTKVGTASNLSKWRRMAEQGAVVAQYVALARDGAVVRLLEDSVTKELGVTQFVRAASKAASLLTPRSTLELELRNREVAGVVREFLHERTRPGFEIADEQWHGSDFARGILAGGPRIAYPQPLDSGRHGMKLLSMLGANALVSLDDAEAAFVVDLGGLKGHRIRSGAFSTDVPALQESLF